MWTDLFVISKNDSNYEKIFILSLIMIMLPAIALAQYYPTKKIKAEYIILDNGDVVYSLSHLTISNDRITVERNETTKYWNVEYQGIQKRKDGQAEFSYHVFYLTTHKTYLIISDKKEVKHKDNFYYRIVFNGQTQLAS